MGRCSDRGRTRTFLYVVPAFAGIHCCKEARKRRALSCCRRYPPGPALTSRPYGGEADLQTMLEFWSSATSSAPAGAFWQLGDVVWGMYQNTVFDVHREARLWEEDGELVGFAWLEEPDGVEMQEVHPRLRG